MIWIEIHKYYRHNVGPNYDPPGKGGIKEFKITVNKNKN